MQLRYLYTLLAYALLPLMLLRLLLRSMKIPAYRQRLPERLGFVPVRPNLDVPSIWIHAVSVGEVVAARPLIEALLCADGNAGGGNQLVLTTSTPTGSSFARDYLPEGVFHAYLPWDTPGALGRFFKRTRPGLLLLIETELWPNLLATCAKNQCVAMLVNARLSARSSNRYRRVKPLVRQMLANLTHIACQTQKDLDNFESLGMPVEAMSLTGSLKAERVVTVKMREEAALLRGSLSVDERPIIVAGSTHEGEEVILLEAYSRVRQAAQKCLLVLAPRHSERCDEVMELCKSRGLNALRRSSGIWPTRDDDVLLLDVLGQLPVWYGAAAIAIIGGSFVPRGGHNVMEAAVWGVPSISGPSTFNFASIYSDLEEGGGALRANNAAEVAQAITGLLDDPVRRHSMGLVGENVVAKNRGACERTLELVRLHYNLL